jgi:hypothetical protein
MKFKTLYIARNVGVLFVNIHTHSEEADPAFAPMDFQQCTLAAKARVLCSEKASFYFYAGQG